MEFYQNNGIPRVRRRNDDTDEPDSDDAPVQIILPNGQIALGFKSQSSFTDVNPDADLSIANGPYVVFSDPPAENTQTTWRRRTTHLFIAMQVIDLTLMTLFLIEAIQNVNDGDETKHKVVNMEAPWDSIIPLLLYVLSVLIAITGLSGVRYGNVRHLTLYIASLLVVFFLGILWLNSVYLLFRYAVELGLCVLANSIRSRLMCSWFSSVRF